VRPVPLFVTPHLPPLTVKAYNGGDRPVTVEGWGFELPDGGNLTYQSPTSPLEKVGNEIATGSRHILPSAL
jgi:hypothetical protein